jgi:hypothetical protein
VTTASQHDTDRWLQSCLQRLVDPDLTVDGQFGPRSRQALKEFQRRAATFVPGTTLTADGIAGPRTISALEAATDTRAPGHATTTLRTAAVAAPEPEPAAAPDATSEPDSDDADDDAEPAAPAASATLTAPADTYVERRIGVRTYGKLDGKSDLLVTVPATSGTKRLHKLAAAALTRMAAAVHRDLAIELKLASAWRAHRWESRAQYEAVVIAKYGSVKEGRRWLAFDSPHETGLAIDIGVGGLTPSRSSVAFQKKQPLFHWLVEHAWEFGFHPYKVEPWHWEFPLSLEAYRSGEIADDDPGPPAPVVSFDPNDFEEDVIEDEDLEEYPTDDQA